MPASWTDRPPASARVPASVAAPAPGAAAGVATAAAFGFGPLRENFRAGLPDRMARIISGEPAERVRAAHQLAGAAGCYGFDALGMAARQVETRLRAGDEAPQSAFGALQAQLQAALAPDA